MKTTKTTKITRKTFEQLLNTNRADLAATVINGTKGYYRKDQGPAASFRPVGTWKQAAITLELIDADA